MPLPTNLIIEPIVSLESVVANGVANASMQTDRRYHRLSFRTFIDGVSAPAEDVIDEIRCVVDRQVIRDMKVSRIRAINEANNTPDESDIVTLHQAEPWQEGFDAQTRTAWAMYGRTNFTVYLKLKPQGQGKIVSIDGLQFYDRTVQQIGQQAFFPVIRQIPVTYGVNNGKANIHGKNLGENICRLWFFATGEGGQPLTRVKVRADGELVYDTNRAEAVALLASYGIKLPDRVPFMIAWDLNGRTEWLTANKEMDYEVYSPISQSIDIVAEVWTNGFSAAA